MNTSDLITNAKQGDPVSARGWNVMAEAARDYIQSRKRAYVGTEIPHHVPFLARITAVNDDYLVCLPWDGESGSDISLGSSILVGKPYLLRVAPFDTFTIDDITYAYDPSVGGATRTLENASAETEDQEVTPSYKKMTSTYGGDMILVQWIGNAMIPSEVAGETVEYIDLNIDGRAFAKIPE